MCILAAAALMTGTVLADSEQLASEPVQLSENQNVSEKIAVQKMSLKCAETELGAGQSAEVKLSLHVSNSEGAVIRDFVVEVAYRNAASGEGYTKLVKNAVAKDGKLKGFAVTESFVPFSSDNGDSCSVVVSLYDTDKDATLIKSCTLNFVRAGSVKAAPEAEPVAEVPAEPAVEKEPEAPAEPVVEKEPEAPAEPVVEKESEAPAEPVVEKEAETPAEPAVEKEPEAPAEPVVEKEPEAPAEPAVEEAAEEPAEEVIEEVTEEPAEEVAEEITEEPVEEVTEEVTEEPAEEVIEEVIEEPAVEVIEEVTEEPAEEITEEVTEEAAEEITEEVTEEEIVEEEPAEEVSLMLVLDSDPAELVEGDTLVFKALVEGLEEGTYTIIWQCDFGVAGEWADIEGAVGSEYAVTFSASTSGWSWRFVVDMIAA